MKNKTVLELGLRMNEIEKEIYDLELEYNKIIEELQRRIPKLENDVNLQPKRRVRKYEDNRIAE